ncbi:peroxisomal sarcosine oxidase-like isoform X1 [Tachypleus tridentatus]|uniref:peroxisomal sarcosine oxidase-like isoform X1 n=1 Tax=Tachypleus tridentatus TaxID=6853 RepID=UPI003FCF9B73
MASMLRTYLPLREKGDFDGEGSDGVDYDVIVIGAGIMGSCTSWFLSSQGKKVLLLEQFPIPHSRGSSHGHSRIIRSAYSEKHFNNIMPDAFQMWKEIEKKSGESLILNTGLLCISRPPCRESELILDNMMKLCPEHTEVLEFQTFERRFPMLKYPKNINVILDKSAGVIRADRAMHAVQTLFKQSGGIIHDSCPVVNIWPGRIVTVVTSKGSFRTSSVVVCAGPWTNKVLHHLELVLPLKPLRISTCYWKEKEAYKGQYSAQQGFPCLLDYNYHSLNDVYGLPSLEYPGMAKICFHDSEECDADQRELNSKTWDVEIVSDFIRDHCPGLNNSPAIVETCIYTKTPDSTFILDRHPKYRNIIIGAGFSGTGFKMGPVIGKILGEMVLDIHPSHDLTPFHLSRFGLTNVMKSQL